jgi:succinate dehydrogenase / fumarate reductase cytochrome b subunit
MIGPYYRPQLTSVLSITHRATGVFLSLVGIPLLLWWIIAVNTGPAAYAELLQRLDGLPGIGLGTVCVFSLCFHFFNGIRHLVWDSGRMLDLPNAYRSGWAVLVVSILATGLIMGALL